MKQIKVLFLLFIISLLFVGCSKAKPEIDVNPNELDFETELVEKNFTIQNTGKAKGLFQSGVETLDYTINPIDDWISVNPNNGSSSGETDDISVTIDRNLLQIGSNTGSINVSSNGGDDTVQILAERTASLTPYAPFPEDYSENQDVNITLSWQSDLATSYDVFFGTTSIPDSLIANNIQQSSIEIDSLIYDEEYYWKVIAKFEDGTAKSIEPISNRAGQKHFSDKEIIFSRDEIEGPIWNFTTKSKPTPHSPNPTNSSSNQNLNLSLSWQCDDAISYSLYFGENNPPTTLVSENFSSPSYNISNLTHLTTYYWQVITILINGETSQSPVWNFTTEDTQPIGYRMIQHGNVETELPAWVKIMFQVTDMDDGGINYLTTENFEIEEDGQPVPYGEAGMQIKKRGVLPYTLKTVLMLDNSNSVAEDLAEIKIAAIEFVNNIEAQQEISLYVFSSSCENLSGGFTDDTSLLINAINSITPGSGATTLYDSLIEGLDSWEDTYSSEGIVQGALIVFTDGSDTSSSSSLSDVLSARGSKRLYSIGLGEDIDEETLIDLANPSPNGYFPIDDVSDLIESFNQIQEDMTLFADSFYWLHYLSPKQEGNHTVKLSIENNLNTGNDSYIEDSFNADGFEPPIAGIFINTSSSNPYGIDELTISETSSYTLEATTYYNENPPDYFWESGDSEIIELTVDPVDFSIAYADAVGDSGQSTTITVRDEANTDWQGNILEKTIDIVIINNTEGSIILNVSEINLYQGESLELTASSINVQNTPVFLWEIVNESIATIEVTGDSTAEVFAVTEGITVLTVSDVANNILANFDVNIYDDQGFNIYDIQYTTEPGGDGTYPSPLEEQEVTVTGIVVGANFGDDNKFFMADPIGGAWRGIYVFDLVTGPSVGDEVSVTGTVTEYYGYTQLNYCSVEILSSGNPVPDPMPIQTVNLSAPEFAEQYEGCLVRVDDVVVTEDLDAYGQWYVDDNSGQCQIDNGFFNLDEVNPPIQIFVGQTWESITGLIDFSYDEFGLNPRTPDDLVLEVIQLK